MRPVHDAEGARAACGRQSPAVVVLDPGLEGAEALARWLLQHQPGARLVLYTSQDGIDPAGLGLAPSTPVLTRSKECRQELAAVVRRLHAEALPCPEEEEMPCSRS